MAEHPIFQKEEIRSCRLCVLVPNCLTSLPLHPQVQAEGLRYYRNMSEYNEAYAHCVAADFHVKVIVEALYDYPSHKKIQLYGVVALFNFCRQARSPAEALCGMDIGVLVLGRALDFFNTGSEEDQDVRSTALKLVRYLKMLEIDSAQLSRLEIPA